MKIPAFVVALAMLLAACAPAPKSSSESNPEPATTGGTASGEPSTSETPKTGGANPGSNPDQPVSSETGGASPTPTPNEGSGASDSDPNAGSGTSAPNPGTNGGALEPNSQPGAQRTSTPPKVKWNPTDVDPKEFGRLMDQTLYELEDAVAEFRVLMQNKEGAGTDAGKIMIANRTKYNIESFSMNELGRIAKDRADGTYRASLTAEGWSDPKPVSSGWMEDNTDLVTNLENKFARAQFRPILVGRPYWFLLVKQLRAKGYKVDLKSNEQLVGGKMRPFYQLSATPKTKSEWTHEVLVDGIRRLAITIRVSKGAEVRQWSANWGFGQPVDDKAYALPKKSASE